MKTFFKSLIFNEKKNNLMINITKASFSPLHGAPVFTWEQPGITPRACHIHPSNSSINFNSFFFVFLHTALSLALRMFEQSPTALRSGSGEFLFFNPLHFDFSLSWLHLHQRGGSWLYPRRCDHNFHISVNVDFHDNIF